MEDKNATLLFVSRMMKVESRMWKKFLPPTTCYTPQSNKDGWQRKTKK